MGINIDKANEYFNAKSPFNRDVVKRLAKSSPLQKKAKTEEKNS